MRPLDGVRVLSFEQAVSAPICTRHLADLGARVTKVEIPSTATQHDITTPQSADFRRNSSGTEWMGFALNYTTYSESEWVPNGMGSPSVAPYGAYPTADGKTVVLGTTNDREWTRFAVQLLNRPELVADRRYATNMDRCTHREELDAIIAAWTVRHDLDRLLEFADAAGIGNATLNSASNVPAHPQLADRHRWRDVDSPVGPVRALLPPFQEPNWDLRMDAVPALGQHTDAILGELGFGPDETRALHLDGAV
jgi:itaconate CoA-transferase